MKKMLLLLATLCFLQKANGQDKKAVFVRAPERPVLTDIKKSITAVQGNVSLFTKNAGNHSQEHDVNSIILDIEKYIDSMPKSRTYSDQLLMKYFNPMRHFYLTTTNKTTVATSFLYSGAPYQFCSYNDTAYVLHMFAIRDGNSYNLSKMTDKKVVRNTLENCLLPSLKALDEFKEGEVKYIALSIYYGCKDGREGAPAGVVVPYCVTLVARLADLQQYATGIITAKGLLANSELYLSDEEDAGNLKRTQVTVE